MSKKENKNNKVKKEKQIVRKENRDGTADYIMKSPTQSVFGKIIVFILAISMVVVVVAGLVVVLLAEAGVIK